MVKALNVKIIIINSFFILSVIFTKAQSSFVIKKVVTYRNAVEITLCNDTDCIVNIPKFTLRITAKDKCKIDYWNIKEDTLYLTFTSTVPSCLQSNIVLKQIKYRDIALKSGGCCMQTLVLNRKIKFKYIIFSYDNYSIRYKKE